MSSEPRLPPAPTPLPPSVDGEAAELTKAFDWTPVIYASVATGILVVVLITIAVMIRVLRVRTPLSPSITPSDLPPSARSAFSASRYSSQFSIEELEPSRQGLPAATSASALHSPRTGGGLGSGSSIGSPLGGSGGVDASLGASATADLN